jgi:hypothetical protein
VWVDDPNDGLPREPFVAGTGPIFCSLSPPAISWPWGQLDWLHDDVGGNWYRSEQSCFVIARDLRSLAPSRASICKTSLDRWVTLLTSTAVSAALVPIPSRTSHEPW